MAWTPPGAGELRQKVKFQRAAAQGNVGGVVQTDFADIAGSARECRLLPLRGGEQVQAARLEGVSAWELVLRADSMVRALTADDRAVNARDAAQIFAIRSILDLDGTDAWRVITLELNVAADGKA